MTLLRLHVCLIACLMQAMQNKFHIQEGESVKQLIWWGFVLLGMSGFACANEKSAEDYMGAAAAARESGDWEEARQIYARAFQGVTLDQADHRFKAVLHYEYGRALGVTCHFNEAERHLNLANDLDKHTGGVFYLSLTELARLNLDQHKYPEALSYLERILAELDPIITARRVPVFYASLLDDYASALAGVGREKDAEAATKKASETRGGTPKPSTDPYRTPYGQQCPPS